VFSLGLSLRTTLTLGQVTVVSSVAVLLLSVPLRQRPGPGIGFVAYSPLGHGFLSGAIRSVDDLPADDARRTLPWFSADNIAANVATVDRVQGDGGRPVGLAQPDRPGMAHAPRLVPIPAPAAPRDFGRALPPWTCNSPTTGSRPRGAHTARCHRRRSQHRSRLATTGR